MKNLLTTSNGVAIMLDKQEARVSHFAISQAMGVKPQSTMKLIQKYEPMLKKHGILGFKIQVFKKRGQPEQVAWLNEAQCFFILTLSRNTAKVVEAKSNLVAAFIAARDCIKQRAEQYLPMHRAAHSAISELVNLAHTQGSTTAESKYHMCYEKLLNAVVGIEAGSRGELDARTQSFFTAAYATIDSTVHAANAQGLHYKETYRLVKRNVTHLASMMIKPLEVAA